ncbi:Ankyrin repeat and SOCS box protein 11 [Armadillidium vulgare]|nr:Ankyrin repeat and SOCS box protein 11 [Armadillidium vulgare]
MPLINDVFQAIIMDDVDQLKQLLKRNVIDLGQRIRGATALSLAVYKANYASVSVLVDFGAPLDMKSKDHLHRIETPLITSIRLGHQQIFLKLLYNGAKLDGKDNYSQCPLWYAVKEQRVAYVNLLLEMGAPITFRCGEFSPLNLLMQFLHLKYRRQMAIELVAVGLQTSLEDHQGKSPTRWTIDHSDFKFFQLLVEAGTPLNTIQISECPKQWIENRTNAEWLESVFCQPPSLMNQCRRVIREYLRSTKNRDIRPFIERLKIPLSIGRYLLLKDAVDSAIAT